MKKPLLFLLLLISTLSFGQSYSIMNSAEGEFMTFSPIYEENELFGYVELRKMNIDENNINTIKYIVLDRNLNTVCSGDLLEKTSNSKRKKRVKDINYADGFIRFEFFEYSQALGEDAFPYFLTFQVVDLKKNTIISKGIYNPDVKDIDKKYDKIDTKGYFTYSLNKSGFLVQTTDADSKIPNESNYFYALNLKNEKIWEFKTSRVLKKHTMFYRVLNYDENYVVLEGYFHKKTKIAQRHIQVLDAKTGKEVLDIPTSSKYTINREYTYLIDGKIYTGGRYFKKDKKEVYRTDESLGIYQTTIDVSKKEVVQDKYIAYSEFPDLKINKYGKIRGEGFLKFQRRGLNPDGTFLILAESYWQKKTHRSYTQLYTFTMDKDFTPVKTVEYDVKRTRGHKYDFSQLLPNKTGRAYFFFDKNDDKDLELNILNYYYKSKKEVIQKLPISNDDSTINVFPAKSGYVAIAEYFKNPKRNGKYMDIRLEKLNYERE